MSFNWCDLTGRDDKATRPAERMITAYCMAKSCATCPLNKCGDTYNQDAKFAVRDGGLAIIDASDGSRLW